MVIGQPQVKRWSYAISKMFEEQALFGFRERHGLEADGVLGRATRAALRPQGRIGIVDFKKDGLGEYELYSPIKFGPGAEFQSTCDALAH